MILSKQTPNIGILYTFENDLSPRLTIWGSYLKIRLCLAWINSQSFNSLSRKACFEFQPRLLRTKGTIMIVGSKGTCWDPEPPSNVAEKQWSAATNSLPHHARGCVVIFVSWLPSSSAQGNGHPLSQKRCRVFAVELPIIKIDERPCVWIWGERKRVLERDRDREGQS